MFPHLDIEQVCGSCWGGIAVEKLEQVKKKRALSIGRQLAKMKGDPTTELGQIQDVLSSVYSEFGGPEDYATHLSWILIQMSSGDKIPAVVPQVMSSLLKLHHEIQKNDDAVDARQMNDAQLRQARELEIAKMVVEAASDPDRRKALAPLLEQSGMKLVDQTADEVIDALAEKTRG